MSEPKCTRWLMSLEKGRIDPVVLPASIRCLAERALQEAGRDWDCPDAGSIIASKLGSLCREHILRLMDRSQHVAQPASNVVDFLLLLLRFLEPIAQCGRPLTPGETTETFKPEGLSECGLPERLVARIWKCIEGRVAVLDNRRTFFASQKRAVQRLEILAARHCAPPQEKNNLPQAPLSVAEPGGVPPQPALACQLVEPRWAVLPQPYVERRSELDALFNKILDGGLHGQWIAVQGGLQVGKSVLLARAAERFEHHFAYSWQRESRAVFVTLDVPANATPEEVEQGQRRLIDDLARQCRVSPPDEAQTVIARASALKNELRDCPTLILVDNVESAQVLEPFRNLPYGTAGVLATRSMSVAKEMAYYPYYRIHLGGLTLAETMELTRKITGWDHRWEWQDITDLHNAVGGNPLAVVIMARAALRVNGWDAVHSTFPGGVCAEEARSTLEGVSRWREVLTREWQRLGQPLRRRLAILGRLPFLLYYNWLIARPLWRDTIEEAQWAFAALAETGWLEPVLVEEGVPAWTCGGKPGSGEVRVRQFRGEYRLPWLAWLFAQEQGHELDLWDQVRCALEARRYSREIRKRGPFVEISVSPFCAAF